MGLHLNLPGHLCSDRRATEHRIRLWWTAYILDRSCASKLGLPISTVADDDILVTLPSGSEVDDSDEDFDDVEYQLRSIQISKIAASCTSEVYSRRKYQTPFLHRVQSVLKDFTTWMDTLPTQLHLRNDRASSLQGHHIVYLHLRLNQVRAILKPLCIPNKARV